jgi:lipopolysaccharide export system protein LptA
MRFRTFLAGVILPVLLVPAWGAEAVRSRKGGAAAAERRGAAPKGSSTERKGAAERKGTAGKPAPAPAPAAKGSPALLEEARTLPIEITADRLQADSGKNSVSFEGNVLAVQGDVTLRADRLFAEYSKREGAIEKVTAEGNVRVVQSSREASGNRAVLYNLEQRIVLSGDVSLAEGENRLKGESVTIFLRENRSVVTGGEEGGRVKAVLFPKGIPELKGKLPR